MCWSGICAGLEKLCREQMWMDVTWLQQLRGSKLYKDVWSACPAWLLFYPVSAWSMSSTELRHACRKYLQVLQKGCAAEDVIWRKQCSGETSSAKRNVGKLTCRTRNQWKPSQPPQKKQTLENLAILFTVFPVMSERAWACFYSLDHFKIIKLFQLWSRWRPPWRVKRSQMLLRWLFTSIIFTLTIFDTVTHCGYLSEDTFIFFFFLSHILGI